MIALADIERDPEVIEYLRSANEMMKALGFTEHGVRHAALVANIAHNILTRLGYSPREADLAAIAGYFHDTGNLVHREAHPQTSALLAHSVLMRLGLPVAELTVIMGAIGNHEEPVGVAVSPIAAAVIIGDKADVHSSRVQNADPKTFDIHDRVNFAVQRSFVRVDEKLKSITLEIQIDSALSSVEEYFEIFINRMIMCRRAAQFLACQFSLVINGSKLM